MLTSSAYDEHCALMRFMHIFSGKWALPTLYQLIEAKQPVRFNELLKRLQPVAQKELSKSLKLLEKHALIHKKIYPEIPPRVEYSITALGQTLKQPVEQLALWMDHYEQGMA